MAPNAGDGRPIHAGDRIKNEDPSFRESKAEANNSVRTLLKSKGGGSGCAQERGDSVLPYSAASGIKSEKPKRYAAMREEATSGCAKDRRSTGESSSVTSKVNVVKPGRATAKAGTPEPKRPKPRSDEKRPG